MEESHFSVVVFHIINSVMNGSRISKTILGVMSKGEFALSSAFGLQHLKCRLN